MNSSPAAVTSDGAPLPTTLDEITPEWLSSALSHAAPGIDVTAIEIREILIGTASKIRVTATFDPAPGPNPPRDLVLKGGFGHHELSGSLRSIYATEVSFYRDLASKVPLRTAPCLFAATDARTGQGLVVLEDVTTSGATFGSPATAAPLTTVRKVLRELARLHGTTWNSPLIADAPIYPADMRDTLAWLLQGERFDRCLAEPRAHALPQELRRTGALHGLIENLWNDYATQSSCLIHGDTHSGNLFETPDGEVGFIDWQFTGRGHWAHDVTYWIVISLDPDDRREHERDLLRVYLSELASTGAPAPSEEVAWQAYRAHLPHGLFWLVNAGEMYPEETNVAVIQRFISAIADHGLPFRTVDFSEHTINTRPLN